MSVSVAEQALVAAAHVAATEFCDHAREERAVGILREVLPLVPIDARRPAYAVRVHAAALAEAGAAQDRKGYEAARRLLSNALVDFFEARMASSHDSLFGAARRAAGQ